MADLVMVKRGALRAGEVGLFIDSPAFEEEFETIRTGTELQVEATQPRNLKQMRLAWSMCGVIAKSGVLGDADRREVMNYLLLKAKHVRYVTNQHRGGIETTPVVKSIRFASMDQTAFNRLFNRMVYIIVSEIIPEMTDDEFRRQIEDMAGVSADFTVVGRARAALPPAANMGRPARAPTPRGES
jgi:hypothetical protein